MGTAGGGRGSIRRMGQMLFGVVEGLDVWEERKGRWGIRWH